MTLFNRLKIKENLITRGKIEEVRSHFSSKFIIFKFFSNSNGASKAGIVLEQ